MDKDTVKQVMRPRYRNIGKGERTRHVVSYSQLTTILQERIGEDATELELLDMLLIEAKIKTLHLMQISSEDITEDDIEWP